MLESKPQLLSVRGKRQTKKIPKAVATLGFSAIRYSFPEVSTSLC